MLQRCRPFSDLIVEVDTGVNNDCQCLHPVFCSSGQMLSTVVPPYWWGLNSKTPSRCLKLWIAPNSLYTMFSLIHIYDKV